MATHATNQGNPNELDIGLD